eukprot:Gb_03470 [translate_table: standard]
MAEALINGLAGAGGGIVAQLITYPLQTVNTRQQTDRKPKNAKSKEGLAITSTKQPNKPTGTLQQICQVIREEGWGKLYSGLMPSLVGTAVSQVANVVYIVVLHKVLCRCCNHFNPHHVATDSSLCKGHLPTADHKVNCLDIVRNRAEVIALDRRKKGLGDGSVGMFSSLIVAAFAGCMNVLLTNPIWVVVTRMQTHTKAQKKILHVKDKESTDPSMHVAPAAAVSGSTEAYSYGTGHAVQELYDEAGILGFWKGVLPTLIMVSNPSIQFMIYESLLKRLRARRALKKEGLQNATAPEIFLLGAIAKLGATVVTYPLLVVKSRLQAKQETGGDKAHHYTGTLDAIAKMIRHEGLSGFYKGMSTKIVQSVFAAAILFMIKEELVKAARALVTKNAKLVKKGRIKAT